MYHTHVLTLDSFSCTRNITKLENKKLTPNALMVLMKKAKPLDDELSTYMYIQKKPPIKVASC